MADAGDATASEKPGDENGRARNDRRRQRLRREMPRGVGIPLGL